MNKTRVRIAPSLLSADFGRLAEEVQAVEAAGADLLHLDVMDGHFVPNLTFGPPVIASLRRYTRLTFDVHLMIEAPDRYLEDFARAGADWISVHAEACPHLQRTLSRIRDLGCKAGVALNPATPLSVVEWVLPDLDYILIMSVNPGFGGQKYLPQSTEKIRRLSALLAERGYTIPIQVDGGIAPDTAAEVVAAGATILVAGSAVFGKEDYPSAVEALRRAAAKAEPQIREKEQG